MNILATMTVRDDYESAVEHRQTRASALQTFLNLNISSDASLAVSHMGYSCGTWCFSSVLHERITPP